MCSIASKIDCTMETLWKWVRRTEIDQGKRTGVTSADRELKHANEILRKAAAFFAQAELKR